MRAKLDQDELIYKSVHNELFTGYDGPVTMPSPIALQTRTGELDLNASALLAIRRLTAIDTVRARIAMAVDLKLLKPGQRLPPLEQIAEAMDVSEVTVRRALTALANEGVLERRRGRNGGTLVAETPTLGSVAETDAYRSAAAEVHALIDQRLLLECGIAHLAALAATKTQLTGLRRLVSAMDRALTWADFHNADERFHIAVAAATKLPSPTKQYGLVLHELYRYYLPYPVDYLRESNREHQQLVDAISERDALGAVQVARRHVETLHETMFVGLINS